MEKVRDSQLDLSVVMPCLNEEATVGICVDDAIRFMQKNGISGEVIVVDNGSQDASLDVAKTHGAKVILEPFRGYGRALRTGFQNAKGKVIIMGDCDTTYDFFNLEEMYKTLTLEKCDMVIGNRYAGGIEHGAMPLTHMLGVRFLSFCGRKKFGVSIYDFHCGMRGFTSEAYKKMELKTDGMEFATELIAEATRKKLIIKEMPVPLRKCTQKRKSKLRTVRDGMRHLLYIVNYKNGNNIEKK